MEAHFEFRTYYFSVVKREENMITVELYSTPYTLIKTKDKWENHGNNKNNMSQGLIGAIIESLGL